LVDRFIYQGLRRIRRRTGTPWPHRCRSETTTISSP